MSRGFGVSERPLCRRAFDTASCARRQTLECEGQRGVDEIYVAIRACGRDKCALKEVGITGISADITIKLPVHLYVNFAANRAGAASAVGADSQDASGCSIDGVLIALA